MGSGGPYVPCRQVGNMISEDLVSSPACRCTDPAARLAKLLHRVYMFVCVYVCIYVYMYCMYVSSSLSI